MEEKAKEIRSGQVSIEDGFWSRMQEKVIDVVIPFQEKVLNDEVPGVEKSHAIENFRIAAGMKAGEFYGMVFQDSDVAKWLEGVAFSLTVTPLWRPGRTRSSASLKRPSSRTAIWIPTLSSRSRSTAGRTSTNAMNFTVPAI